MKRRHVRRSLKPSTSNPSLYLISDLCADLNTYLEPHQVAQIYRAYLFAAEAHEGQLRKSGEAYIFHPIAVARILCEMRLDYESIVAAILHDVIEDTPTAKETISSDFGEQVAQLVDGVSKLTNIKFITHADAQAENFRKMVMAMVQDMRVIFIKLADRLHNMRTLAVMRPEKQRRIATETLEIYAPIAQRIGLNAIRLELEELGFQACYPMRYRAIASEAGRICGGRRDLLAEIIQQMIDHLKRNNIEAAITGRKKHLYSIYQKMRDKHLPFSQVMDLIGCRIIVNTISDCYLTLGLVHNLYKPKFDKFKDYIAIPKANGYQSLHTTLQSRYEFPIEVQIRTHEMDRIAEHGIASHWSYKDGDNTQSIAHTRTREWLKDIIEMQRQTSNSEEFLENVKVDLFPDEVYVFTPRGDIMALPQGATAIDFAYAVHTHLGNHCVGIKVDHARVPLHTPLKSGQKIEVITSPTALPNPSWLNFVTTAKARTNIRNYLKSMQHQDSLNQGMRLLENALNQLGSSIETVGHDRLTCLMREINIGSSDELYRQIGLGDRLAPIIAAALNDSEQSNCEIRSFPSTPDRRPHFSIKGSEGSVITYARCCRPIPGDPIFGYLSAGRGIVIHTQECNNIQKYRKHPEKWIFVGWEEQVEGEFKVDLVIAAANRPGVLATVAAAIAEKRSNIDNIYLDEQDGSCTTIKLTISVTNRRHLAQIMRRLRKIEDVMRLRRGSIINPSAKKGAS
ncbi:MAG: bifunctional (p)ppGpp synthetase/guanosine-3',5'-bis(diphosphate) 3'-pyrophosphohydrolase [Gammaproteobacteria bacterium]|nr:bifunctional (p)ppGpp synthetase/guanosine-3',5'-bis(diphosphate) 3'-pyrophosphohydrolase [Gammaproteobacteria bacterium]